MENKIYIACEYKQGSNVFKVTAISNMSTYDINQEAILDDTIFDFSKIEGYIGYTHTDGNLHVKFDQSTYDAYLQEQQEKEALKKADKASSLFAEILTSTVNDNGIVTENDVKEWTHPDSTNPYKQGDKVKFNGKTYESLIDNNVWSPEAYPAGWKEV